MRTKRLFEFNMNRMNLLFSLGVLLCMALLTSCDIPIQDPDPLPPLPTGITLVNVVTIPGNSEMTVSWNAVNNESTLPDSIRFSVKYQLTGESLDSCNNAVTKGSCMVGCDWFSSGTSCKITGLTNGTSYNFIVISFATYQNPYKEFSAFIRSAPATPNAN